MRYFHFTENRAELCSDLSKLKLSEKDIISIEGCVLDDEQDENDNEICKYSDCDECNYQCEKCGMCKLWKEAYNTSDECLDCRLYGEKCGACTYDEDLEDEYMDEEFELRKQIFKDYISDIIDEVIEYGKDLFEVE